MTIDKWSNIFNAVGLDLNDVIDTAIAEYMPKWLLYSSEDDHYLWYTLNSESPPELKRIGWGDFGGSSPIDKELMDLLFMVVDGKDFRGNTWSDIAGDLIGALVGYDVYAVPVVDGVVDFTRCEKLMDANEKYGYR